MKYLSESDLEELFKKNIAIFSKISSIKKSLDIIFVFGASVDESTRGHFKLFLQQTPSLKLNYITIEELTNDLRKHALTKGIGRESIKLILLEEQAMEYAYAIVIFPESPGSFAELGYFAKTKEIRNKIIAIKNFAYCDDKSYVNYLIEFVHEHRELSGYTMHFLDKHSHTSFVDENRNNRFPRILSDIEKSFHEEHSDPKKMYKNIEYMKKHSIQILLIILLHECLRIFKMLVFHELKIMYKIILDYFKLLDHYSDDTFKLHISILVVSNDIKRTSQQDVYFFHSTNKSTLATYACSSNILEEQISKNEIQIYSLREQKKDKK